MRHFFIWDVRTLLHLLPIWTRCDLSLFRFLLFSILVRSVPVWWWRADVTGNRMSPSAITACRFAGSSDTDAALRDLGGRTTLAAASCLFWRELLSRTFLLILCLCSFHSPWRQHSAAPVWRIPFWCAARFLPAASLRKPVFFGRARGRWTVLRDQVRCARPTPVLDRARGCAAYPCPTWRHALLFEFTLSFPYTFLLRWTAVLADWFRGGTLTMATTRCGALLFVKVV